MPNLTTSPWQAAVDRISGKTVVGSRLRSAEWAQMPQALRERGLFSAGVENLRVLSAMREKLSQAAQQVRTDGTLMDKGRFVAELRAMLGAAPGDSGDLADLTSRSRLELIWEFQQQDAHGFAAREADLDPDVLDAYPAYRFTRIEGRKRPRLDWFARWGVAGAKVGWVGASRASMAALKTSPIWAALSRFGRPWAPFDFGSGMGLEDVDRDAAEALGLLPKDQPPADRLRQHRDDAAAARRTWNDGLQASVKGLAEQTRAWMKEAFGDQIVFDGDTVRWLAGPPPKSVTPQPAMAEDRAAQKTWADTQMHPRELGLDAAQTEAARGYQDVDYSPINSSLRAGRQLEEMHPGMRKQIETLDAAIARSTVPVDLTVYRGTRLAEIAGDVGDIKTYHPFVSTSLARAGAETFVEDAMLEIRVPAGKTALYMDGLNAEQAHEVELLLPRGAQLRILSKTRQGNTWHIIAELL